MAMGMEHFDFRWGVPELDAGHTSIPNVILQNHAALGITPQEMMLIIHMASFKYDSMRTQGAMPSQPTLAARMGYSRRGLQKMIGRLVEAGWLQVIGRSGQTCVYDFGKLAQKCIEMTRQNTREPEFTCEPQFAPTCEPQFAPTCEPQFAPPANPSSHEEEKEEQKTKKIVEKRSISNDLADAIAAYEQHIGAITPLYADTLNDLISDYGIAWVIDAINVMVERKTAKRSLQYVQGILRNWKAEGKREGIQGKPATSEKYDAGCKYGCEKGYRQDSDGNVTKCQCRIEREQVKGAA